ncbi:NAD(P)-binding protein [Rhizodiscina lignyota]|uniref:NAD(P)-binding protein n=1 Tax=Rhizodiscina lignyota TaxID=1504668 RepID=A0A9P4M4L5_9PEZI|nr:NAD(P)-binding protein [Rhizodiscina lignyota]
MIALRLDIGSGSSRYRTLDGRVFVVTGGAQGLGLTMAEALVEAGGHVYCLDRQAEAAPEFYATKEQLAQHFQGSLNYRRVDVQHAKELDEVVAEIAGEHQRMDGLVAAAGVQRVTPALEYPPEKITAMMNINYGGVYLSAVSCARQMIKYKTPGAMVLIGSMSGLIANKGFTSTVYNSSKAAVIQLGRSLAMEWGKIVDGKPIRVNVLCPGNIITPMVRKNFEDDPGLREIWERENMLGRISEPHEYRGAVLFMLSDASSFMTGSHLVIDGGYTAW